MTTDDHTRPAQPDVTAAAARGHVRRLLASARARRTARGDRRLNEATGPYAQARTDTTSDPSATRHTNAGTVLADALLVTSELVTNALRHGGGVASFTASLSDDTLRISVADRAVEAPHCKRAADGFLPGGHGWPLVQRLCLSVEIAPSPGGKTIHARLGVA
ncbi:ATP-binding protein [Streptomyces sp. PmtA]|uniref:ATP-binding protein n=1 Tax=Streptomyces sp. PmtA TaxID=3074275 RepID=UPI0030153974